MTVMSHPFQAEVGDRDEPSTDKGGWLHQSQPRGGGGADYVNVPLQYTVSPRTVLILKSCPRSQYHTIHMTVLLPFVALHI